MYSLKNSDKGGVMAPWGYEQYLISVRRNMEYCLVTRNYNVDQSFGFSHNQLLARLDEYPHETPLALTALAIVLNEYAKLIDFSSSDDFVKEILDEYSSPKMDLAIEKLNYNDAECFRSHVATIKSILSI
jgi:hypothetical protein